MLGSWGCKFLKEYPKDAEHLYFLGKKTMKLAFLVHGSQRVGHNLATEQQQQYDCVILLLNQWLLHVNGFLLLIKEITYRALMLMVQQIVRNEARDHYGTEKIHVLRYIPWLQGHSKSFIFFNRLKNCWLLKRSLCIFQSKLNLMSRLIWVMNSLGFFFFWNLIFMNFWHFPLWFICYLKVPGPQAKMLAHITSYKTTSILIWL